MAKGTAYVWLGLLAFFGLTNPTETIGQPYPSRPIRVIVPGAAGGVLDIGIRKISENLSQYLGQPVIVDNRPGANGFIAAEAAARAKPDGYTVFMAPVSTLCSNPALFTKLPYDPEKDFAPVSLAAIGNPILLVSPRMPVRNLSEFVAHAKARPGEITYGSPNIGSPQHITMVLLEQLTGIRLVHVPYKNHPQVLMDVAGGQIDATIEYASMAAPHVKSGKLRALAVAGPRRKPAMPDIPTGAEAGVPGFDLHGWNGYMVPAGTPREIIDRLHKDITAALKSRENVEFIESFGSEVVASTPEEFESFINIERTKWAKLIKAAGIRLE
jgi:tripartite-type tricarboxylate transporter receptor subunit TctC